jgi:predicted  nucleic acid-binding Zn-ribbon protein
VIYTGYEGMSQDELVRLIENGDDKPANELLARFLILLEDQKEGQASGELAELKHNLKNAKRRISQAERQIADDGKEIAKLKRLCLKLSNEKAELIKKTADMPAFW